MDFLVSIATHLAPLRQPEKMSFPIFRDVVPFNSCISYDHKKYFGEAQAPQFFGDETPKHHRISRQELSETEEQLATVPLEDAQQAEGQGGVIFDIFVGNLKHAHRPYYHITLKER